MALWVTASGFLPFHQFTFGRTNTADDIKRVFGLLLARYTGYYNDVHILTRVDSGRVLHCCAYIATDFPDDLREYLQADKAFSVDSHPKLPLQVFRSSFSSSEERERICSEQPACITITFDKAVPMPDKPAFYTAIGNAFERLGSNVLLCYPSSSNVKQLVVEFENPRNAHQMMQRAIIPESIRTCAGQHGLMLMSMDLLRLPSDDSRLQASLARLDVGFQPSLGLAAPSLPSSSNLPSSSSTPSSSSIPSSSHRPSSFSLPQPSSVPSLPLPQSSSSSSSSNPFAPRPDRGPDLPLSPNGKNPVDPLVLYIRIKEEFVVKSTLTKPFLEDSVRDFSRFVTNIVVHASGTNGRIHFSSTEAADACRRRLLTLFGQSLFIAFSRVSMPKPPPSGASSSSSAAVILPSPPLPVVEEVLPPPPRRRPSPPVAPAEPQRVVPPAPQQFMDQRRDEELARALQKQELESLSAQEHQRDLDAAFAAGLAMERSPLAPVDDLEPIAPFIPDPTEKLTVSCGKCKSRHVALKMMDGSRESQSGAFCPNVHFYCSTCLRQQYRTNIEQGIYGVKCHSCEANLKMEDVRSITGIGIGGHQFVGEFVEGFADYDDVV